MLDENEMKMRSMLLDDPPSSLDAATLLAIRRETRAPRVFWRKLPMAASIAAVLGAAAFGIGEYARTSASLDSDGEMILEMTCMAEVSDFYGDFED